MKLPPRALPRHAPATDPHSAPMAAPRRVARTPPQPRALSPVQRLRAALKAAPQDHAARERLARLLLDQGDLPGAEAELTLLLKAPKHAQAARRLLCRLHRSVNREDKAIHWGRLAVQQGPRDAEAHRQLGLAYLGARERSKAIAELEAAARLAPKRAVVWQSLGRALIKSHKPREALKALRTAQELAPKQPAPLTLLGDAYWALSLHGKAEQAYKQAVRLTAGPPVYRAIALDKLGVLYKVRGFFGRARKVLEACQRLFPQFGCPYTEVALLPANPIKIPGGTPERRY